MLEAGQFDRSVSIEMFEHMRNYDVLLGRIASWLRPGGKLFVHIFAHKTQMYQFETAGDDNWMGRHFIHRWPDARLRHAAVVPARAADRAALARRRQPLPAHRQPWLANQDARRDAVMATLIKAYGTKAAPLWFQRWRMFWMSCAELFGYANGQEWLVAHYRFVRP